MPDFIMYILKGVLTNTFSCQWHHVDKVRGGQGGWGCRQAALREGGRRVGALGNRAAMMKTVPTNCL